MYKYFLMGYACELYSAFNLSSLQACWLSVGHVKQLVQQGLVYECKPMQYHFFATLDDFLEYVSKRCETPEGSITLGVHKNQIAVTGVSPTVRNLTVPSVARAIVAGDLDDCVPDGNSAMHGLETVVMHDAVEFVRSGCFQQCTKLRDVRFSAKLKCLYDNAFNGCTALKHLDLPDSLRSISYRCFNDCTSLTYVKLPKNLKSIHATAFAGCNNVETLILPDKTFRVTGADDDANGVFYPFSKLKHLYVPVNCQLSPKELLGIGERPTYGVGLLTRKTLPDVTIEISSENMYRGSWMECADEFKFVLRFYD